MKPKARVAGPEEMRAVVGVIRSANPHLEARISTFLAAGACWHEATPIVCELSKQIVSCACVFRRCVRTQRGEASFGGIGAVATLPEARGRGCATLVMKECEDLLRRRGCRTALLFCTIVDFYARLEWSPVQEDWVEFTLSPRSRIAGASSYDLRRLDLAEIPASIRTLCDRASGPFGGAMVRSDGVWDEYGRWRREDPDLFWAARADDRPVAYVRGRRMGSELRLLEAACQEGHERALLVLLERQRKVVAGPRDARFNAFLSRAHPLAALLADAGVDPAWRQTGADTGIMMIKDLGGASRASRAGQCLVTDDFEQGLPWHPRTWWGVDRF